MELTKLEKEVLGLSKALAPIPDNVLEDDLTWACRWQDWDVNCHYADVLTIGDVCGRFQVYRHYDIEMEDHYEEICKNHPDDYPEWVEDYAEMDEIEWETATDDKGNPILDEEGNPVEYGWAFGSERNVYCECGQHWLDTTTGEVVFLGRPYRKSGKICSCFVGEQKDPLEVIRPEGETERWFDRWNSDYGNLNHYDYRIHDNLKALRLDTTWLDFEYDYSDFNDWYSQRPWHERVMLPDLGLREDGREEWERIYKMGGLPLLIKCADEYLRNKDDYLTAYKICLRNHYTPACWDEWFTLIDLLVSHKKDIRNAHYVCPANLTTALNKLRGVDTRAERDRKEKRLAEEEIERYKKDGEMEEQTYQQTHSKYIKLEFEVGGIKYKVLHDVKSFLEQGIKMHHCIYHHRYYEKTDTLILEARVDGKLVENIELDLLTGKVIEAHGKRNSETPLHKQVIEDVQSIAHHYSDIYWSEAI